MNLQLHHKLNGAFSAVNARGGASRGSLATSVSSKVSGDSLVPNSLTV